MIRVQPDGGGHLLPSPLMWCYDTTVCWAGYVKRGKRKGPGAPGGRIAYFQTALGYCVEYFSKIRGVPNLLPSSLTPNILRNNRGGGLLTPISTDLLFRRILEQGRGKRLGTPLVIWFLAESVQSIPNKFSVVGMCVCVWKICTPSQEASRSRIRSVGSAWRSERIWVVLWLFTNTYSIVKHAGNVFFGFPTCVLSRKI